jgi:tetratricopeptide (TPR) repeat protein
VLDTEELLTLFNEAKYSEVISHCEKNEDFLLNDPNSSYIYAACHFKLGSYQQAQNVCERIEGPYQNNENFLSMYAAILRRQGLFERSEEFFRKALSLNETDEIKNNFSNLLIDRGRYIEAKDMLQEIVQKNPHYEDARINLTRVSEILSSNEKSKKSQISSNNEKFNTSDYSDPIEAAFAVGEVIKCGAKVGNETSEALNIIDIDTNVDLEQAELDSLQIAEELVQKNQNRAALDVCNQIRKRKGSNFRVYRTASDAYLGMKEYQKAETYGFQAFILGDQSTGLKINLCNFAAMRGDFYSARYWLNEAKMQDPSNEAVTKTIDIVFKDIQAKLNNTKFN